MNLINRFALFFASFVKVKLSGSPIVTIRLILPVSVKCLKD